MRLKKTNGEGIPTYLYPAARIEPVHIQISRSRLCSVLSATRVMMDFLNVVTTLLIVETVLKCVDVCYEPNQTYSSHDLWQGDRVSHNSWLFE